VVCRKKKKINHFTHEGGMTLGGEKEKFTIVQLKTRKEKLVQAKKN